MMTKQPVVISPSSPVDDIIDVSFEPVYGEPRPSFSVADQGAQGSDESSFFVAGPSESQRLEDLEGVNEASRFFNGNRRGLERHLEYRDPGQKSLSDYIKGSGWA